VKPDADGSSVAYMIPPYQSNHASTIEALPDGSLAAAWFSGVKEEAPGCAIVFAKLPAGSDQWSKAQTLSKRADYSNQNPVLFYDHQTSTLHLYHSQAPAEAGETEAQIWHLSSSDGGQTWTTPAAWLKTPGSFSRNRIIRGHGGGVIFPFYSATRDNKKFKNKNYSIMGFGGGMNNTHGWSFKPVDGSADLVQPSTVPYTTPAGKPQLITLFRDRNAKHVYRAESHDDGQSWSTPKALDLPNNNAGIEAFTLKSGNIVLVFNPQTSGRDPLAVALSSDGGSHWSHKTDIQHGQSLVSNNSTATRQLLGGNEFSYPTVLQTKDGNIHIMYTYLRQTIKYKRVTEKWIQSQRI